MRINYSDEEVVTNEKSIFFAGPTPRDMTLAKWRIEACKYLEELGFDGTIYIPEYKSAKNVEGKVEQEMWERKALSNASIILFWIPRELPDMPGFTTNVEFGYWIHSGKIIYGRPDDSVKNGYLDWLYELDTEEKPFNDLKELVNEAASRANEIGVNTKTNVLSLKERKMMN